MALSPDPMSWPGFFLVERRDPECLAGTCRRPLRVAGAHQPRRLIEPRRELTEPFGDKARIAQVWRPSMASAALAGCGDAVVLHTCGVTLRARRLAT